MHDSMKFLTMPLVVIVMHDTQSNVLHLHGKRLADKSLSLVLVRHDGNIYEKLLQYGHHLERTAIIETKKEKKTNE